MNYSSNQTSSNTGKLLLICAAVFVVFFMSHMLFSDSTIKPNKINSNLRPEPGCDTVWCLSDKNNKEIHFGIVADLDRQSKVEGAKKPTWRSIFKEGILKKENDSWHISWKDKSVELLTQLGEAGRGMELSELVTWKNKLWTFDDRSGVVFEIQKGIDGESDPKAVPRHILMEGDGNNNKGQKTEWATVKDGDLYVGSFGKPYTNNAGEITTRNNMWISKISNTGAVSHVNWIPKFEKMQEVTDSIHPGYMIHEAIHWDSINKLWYVLPRRVSHDSYDEKKDEEMGSNLLLVFNEDFSELKSKLEIGEKVATHGWSSFKFVPWTNNKVVMALRTMELENKETGDGTQETYLTVFGVDGTIFLSEQKIPGDYKFEGIEFL